MPNTRTPQIGDRVLINRYTNNVLELAIGTIVETYFVINPDETLTPCFTIAHYRRGPVPFHINAFRKGFELLPA